MLKEDIDMVTPIANALVDKLVDNIICGPELTEEQIKAIWSILEQKAKHFSMN